MEIRQFVKGLVLALLSLGVITSRVGYYIVTPLWFDYFKHSTFDFANITNGSWWKNCTLPVLPYATAAGINATFLLVGQFGFTMIVTGVILLNMMFVCPNTLSEKDHKYPKFKLFLIGFAMTMSSLGFNYAISGTRTPPYLQAILGNFNIPIQFFTR